MNREKRTGSLLLKLGIKPEPAAVSLNATNEALLKRMPDKAHGTTLACYSRKPESSQT